MATISHCQGSKRTTLRVQAEQDIPTHGVMVHSQCLSVLTQRVLTLSLYQMVPGCNSNLYKTITVNPPFMQHYSYRSQKNNTICQGQSAQLCGPSGSGYTYSWSNGSYISNVISVNCAGIYIYIYIYTVTNASGCRSTCRVSNLRQPGSFCSISTLGLRNNNTICSGQSVHPGGPFRFRVYLFMEQWISCAMYF